jgi:hypothetical protein
MAAPISESIVGRSMPGRTTTDFRRFCDELDTALFTTYCPLIRGTTVYISTSGDDVTGDGSFATPWATITKVNSYLAANLSNVAVLLKCGDVWTGTTGIDVPAGAENITVATYGDGNAPFLNAFASTLASGGTLWTNAAGNRYTTSISQPGDFREQLNRDKAYRRVASTAEVESTANSYYWTGGTMHVHATNAAGTAVDPDTIAYEYTLASTTPDTGVDVASGATNVRVDGLRAEGFGCNGSVGSNQNYQFRSQASGTDIHAFTNCVGHRSARHVIAMYGGSTEGGFAYFGNCTAGYATEEICSPFNCYASDGGHEGWFVGCTADYGALPTTAARTWADGIALLFHTDGDPSGFACSIGLRVAAPANGFGCHIGPQFNDFDYEADPDQCDGVIIGTIMEEALGTGSNNGSTGHAMMIDGVVEMDSDLRFKPNNSSTEFFQVAPPRGFMYNCRIRLNMASISTGWFGFWNTASTRTPKMRGCHFEIISNGSTDFGLDYLNNFSAALEATIAASDGSEMSNCIFQVIRANPADTVAVIRPALRNEGTYQHHNAYFGVSADGAIVGISEASNCITLGSPHLVGQNFVTKGSHLVGEGSAFIDFDMFGTPRSAVAPTIGPIEYLPSSAMAPTLLEITDQIIATLGTPVSADVVDDSRTWFATDYRARNIVSVAENFEGTLSLMPDINPGSAISSVTSVSITGAATVTATELTTNRARTRAQFTVPALTAAGTYTVVVTVTTTDSQTIPTTATLKVQ